MASPIKIGTGIAFGVMVLFAGGLWGCPQYHVWQQGMAGQAAFAKAEQDRQIKVQEAKAHFEASKFFADAEIERAKGTAKSNEIIGESLKNNESYLHWLWIEGMKDNAKEGNQIIYVPTEAGLPILEAGKRK